jgi:integrase
MTLMVIHGLRVTMKYVVDNNGSLSFQRAVPKALQRRYPKKLIRVPLPRVQSIDQLKAIVDELKNETTQLFRLMKDDPQMLPAEAKRAVNAVFKNLGIKIDPDGKVSDQDRGMFEDAYAAKFDQDVSNIGHWKVTQRFLSGDYSLLLSECPEVYLKVKAIDLESKAGQRVVRDWNRFLGLTGDMSLQQLNREQIRSYVQKRLNQGAKTGTVRRELNTLRASVALALLERKLVHVNPFEGIVIPKEGSDASEKVILTTEELVLILTEAFKQGDQLRLLAVVLSHTGMRIAEAVGLRKSDCKVSSGIRYLLLEPHDARTLKTKNSRREIPIVGLAEQAIDRLMQSISRDEPLFGNYVRDGAAKSNSASGAINKWMRQVTGNDQATSHCFRHTLEDMMREANVPKPIQTAIGGWGKTDMSDNYGKGYSLRVKKEALEAALAPLCSSVTNASETYEFE